MASQTSCDTCGKRFEKTTRNQRNCSDICKKINKKEKAKDRQDRFLAKKNKLESSEEEIAAQEIDLGRVKVFDIKIPEALQHWTQFVRAYSAQQGTLIKFRKEKDSSTWKIDDPDEKEIWTVQRWIEWFEGAKKNENKEEAFYLVDVHLLPTHIKKLRETNPLVDAFSFKGKYCFSGYVKYVSEHIPLPDVSFLAYISPPWGRLMTYPHKDGYGSQLAVHCCVMGDGKNLVHYWPRLTASQESLFREITGLKATGEPQKVPHEFVFTIDDNPNVWDENLEKRLLKVGVKSSSFELKAGQAVILPPEQFHCFKKVFSDRSSVEIPLIGVACDATYIGMTENSFETNYNCIKAIQARHPWNDHIYGIIDLYLYCLFAATVSEPSLFDDRIARAHLKGALPYFEQWIEEQKEELMRVKKLVEIDAADVMKDFDEEITCNVCKLPLVNIFVAKEMNDTGEGSTEIRFCTKCIINKPNEKSKKKSKGNNSHLFRLRYRFDTLENLKNLAIDVKKNLQKMEELIEKRDEDSVKMKTLGKRKRNQVDAPETRKKAKTNISKEELEKEIDIFTDRIMGIFEGHIETELAKEWHQKSSEEKRNQTNEFYCGGFNDEELDLIFEFVAKKVVNSGQRTLTANDANFINCVIWPDLGAKILSSRNRNLSESDALQILMKDSRHDGKT